MSNTKHEPRVIVVGGGLAGLAATVRIAEAGLPVDLFSLVPVKRSHSVCAQGGINACNEVARQQGYSEYQHFDETIYGGDYLADQHPVLEMTNWAPRIIDLLDRMGVPFNRTSEGFRDLRLFGGSLFKRTHFSGATTGQQLMYALDEQVRRYESEGKVTKYEFWEFLWPVVEGDAHAGIDQGRCMGIVAQDHRTMQVRAFRGDAVVMATGGPGLVFGKSTNSVMCNGAAAARIYQAGAMYANAEMIQVHPTAIPGADKCRLMSESARGEGGRVWVPKQAGDGREPTAIPEGERWYFLEDRYPKYGNLVPRDIATREIFDVCVNMKMGIGGGNMVYLDLTHRDPDYLTRKLGGIMEIYEKFVGEDPRFTPMKIFPAVHYSMGGVWTRFTPGSYTPHEPAREHKPGMVAPVDTAPGRGMAVAAPDNGMTSIRGLYAFGEVSFAYHGATRLGANALLSCIFDGLFCGQGVVTYVNDDTDARVGDAPQSLYDAAVAQEEAKMQRLLDGVVAGGAPDEANPYVIGREMGQWMNDQCTVVKTGDRLRELIAKIDELKGRYAKAKLPDSATWSNQSLAYCRAVGDMLALGDLIARASEAREESRGSHYRLDFEERDDERFLKASIGQFDRGANEPRLSWREVDTSLVKPRPRTYGKVEADSPGMHGPTTADDPKAHPRVANPAAEPDINGQPATASGSTSSA